MTARLYWEDPLLLAFDARVLAQARAGDRPAFVLDATGFYPEAGGQLADRGSVSWDGGSAPLVDATEDEDLRVLHVVAAGAALPPMGAPVRVTVDEARRRVHMSQHTGQHLLSRALLDVAGAATASSRLGDEACTIDTPLATLPDERLADAEALVTRIVLEDRPVRALRPTADELAAMPLRREPKVTSNVRVIDIDGFDLSPCGGTHCQRTGQVGPVRITGVERHKGGLRITFLAGARAAADDAARSRTLGTLARELTCGVPEVTSVVRRLTADAKDQARAVADLQARLARHVAAELVTQAGGRAVVRVLDEPLEFVRALAAGVVAAGPSALLGAREGDVVRLVFARGEGRAFEAGAALKRVAQACGGRGGGRPDRAEGAVPAGPALQAALEAEAAGA